MQLFGSVAPCEIVRSISGLEANEEIELVVRATERLLGGRKVDLLDIERVTTKGTALRVQSDGRRLFAKRHRSASAYKAETSCYHLLAGLALTPDLIGFDDGLGLMLLSDIGDDGRADQAAGTHWHFTALGHVHTAWERASRTGTASRYGFLRDDGAAPCSGPERDLVASFRRRMPPGWVPMSIADPKPEHVVGPRTGRRLVDFEQTATGRFDLFDVVMLAAQSGLQGLEVDEAFACYDEGRRQAGSAAPRIAESGHLLLDLADRAAAWLRDLSEAVRPGAFPAAKGQVCDPAR